jgi:hypothetical protein
MACGEQIAFSLREKVGMRVFLSMESIEAVETT